MTLWNKLEELGYHKILVTPQGNKPGGYATNLIVDYFKRNLTLRECKLVKKEHEEKLREYY